MLLAQKPQSISFRHRRQPASLSAITVVPHPTNTPGLFAIAKPIRQQPRPLSRPQSPRCTPRGRPHRSQHPHQHPHRHHHHPSLSVAHSPETVKEELNAASSDSSQSPPKKTPGAQNEDIKPVFHIQEAPAGVPPLATDAQSPQRSPRPRRSRHKSTPAVPSTPTFSSEFNSGQSPTIPDRSMPEKNQENKALSRISDARVPSPVQQHPLPPATPIPVPERRRNQSPSHRTPLSKSEPGKSKLTIQTSSPVQPPKSSRKRRKNKAKRLQDGSNLPLSDWDFPVKESDDDGEVEVEDTEPSSPIRTVPTSRRSWLNDGPKTAPLEPSRQQFPFFTFPTRASPSRARTPAPRSVDPFALAPAAPITPPRQIRPDHRRAPSQPASLSRGTFIDGVFHFSDDEGDRSPGATDIQKKMAMLFGKKLASDEAGFSSSVPPLLSTSTPSPRRKMGRERDSTDAGRQLFASSSFQIAPEPIELPVPSFISRSKLDLMGPNL